MNIKENNNKIVVFLFLILILTISIFSHCILKKEQIKIIMNGEEIITSSFKSTIKEFLDEQGIKYDNNDKITPNLDTKLKDNIQIKIVKVDIKGQKEYENIPFEITIDEDNKLFKGETVIVQDRNDGEKETVYKLIYEDDKLVEKKLVSEKITKNPTDEIVKSCTKENAVVASRSKTSRSMNVVATAYSVVQ